MLEEVLSGRFTIPIRVCSRQSTGGVYRVICPSGLLNTVCTRNEVYLPSCCRLTVPIPVSQDNLYEGCTTSEKYIRRALSYPLFDSSTPSSQQQSKQFNFNFNFNFKPNFNQQSCSSLPLSLLSSSPARPWPVPTVLTRRAPAAAETVPTSSDAVTATTL